MATGYISVRESETVEGQGGPRTTFGSCGGVVGICSAYTFLLAYLWHDPNPPPVIGRLSVDMQLVGFCSAWTCGIPSQASAPFYTVVFFCLAIIVFPRHGHRPPAVRTAFSWGLQTNLLFVIPNKYWRQGTREKCSSSAPASSVTRIWEPLL